MGSEGSGLRTTVRRACNSIVMIPAGLGPRDLRGVDSLNVSVATGILLHELTNRAGGAAEAPSA